MLKNYSFLAFVLALSAIGFAQSRETRMGVNGSSGSSGPCSTCVTTDTIQNITGAKTFTVSQTMGGNLSFSGAGTFSLGSANSAGRMLYRSNIGAATASTTVAASTFQHENGALDATDLELQVLTSASVQLFGVQENGLALHRSGLQMNIAGDVQPACAAGTRGTIWYTLSAGGVADRMEVCAKSAADAYAWRVMATIP